MSTQAQSLEALFDAVVWLTDNVAEFPELADAVVVTLHAVTSGVGIDRRFEELEVELKKAGDKIEGTP